VGDGLALAEGGVAGQTAQAVELDAVAYLG
jgi:hypothetical protein